MNLPKPEPELLCDLIDSLNKRWGVPFDVEDALKQSEEHHYAERRRLADELRKIQKELIESLDRTRDLEDEVKAWRKWAPFGVHYNQNTHEISADTDSNG